MVNSMNFLSNNVVANKRVILRCDFNVPVKNGEILDSSKIEKSLKTIIHLLENNNIVILLSHFGRIKKEEDKEKNSLYIVYENLKKYIDLEFIENPLDLSKIDSSTKKCFLVENTRFTDLPHKKESANDLELANYWSNYADIFVLDAFASSHRAHSSTAGLSKYLPTYIGFLMEEEITGLKNLVEKRENPFIVIMGGAKVDDKIKIIEGLLEKCDKLILTGGILNTFLKVASKKIGKSLVSEDTNVLNNVKSILDRYKAKIYFTDQFVVKRDNDILSIKSDDILDEDIIYDNIPIVKDILADAKTIFFNGTCGKYEESEFSLGTKTLLCELQTSNAKVFVGGGDTVSAVKTFEYDKSFDYLSSGGGATLEYVAYGKLKALEWIEENGVDN